DGESHHGPRGRAVIRKGGESPYYSFKPTPSARLNSGVRPQEKCMRALRLTALLFLLSAQCIAQADEPLSAGVEALMARARAGDAEAQFQVATAYDWGEGAPRDGAEALKWYELSASSGHAEAQNSMGSALQAEGKYEQALVWYERAAEQNHAIAMNNL